MFLIFFKKTYSYSSSKQWFSLKFTSENESVFFDLHPECLNATFIDHKVTPNTHKNTLEINLAQEFIFTASYRFSASLYLAWKKQRENYEHLHGNADNMLFVAFHPNHKAIFPYTAVKQESLGINVCVYVEKALCQYISYHSWLPPQLPLYDTMPFSDSQLLKEMKAADGK